MTINQKINAKGNAKVFYTWPSIFGMIRLIKQEYKKPYENIYLPDRLYLKHQYRP